MIIPFCVIDHRYRYLLRLSKVWPARSSYIQILAKLSPLIQAAKCWQKPEVKNSLRWSQLRHCLNLYPRYRTGTSLSGFLSLFLSCVTDLRCVAFTWSLLANVSLLIINIHFYLHIESQVWFTLPVGYKNKFSLHGSVPTAHLSLGFQQNKTSGTGRS